MPSNPERIDANNIEPPSNTIDWFRNVIYLALLNINVLTRVRSGTAAAETGETSSLLSVADSCRLDPDSSTFHAP